MEAGEIELRKAFEDTTTNNVKAVLNYCTETRKLVRELEQKVISLDGLIRNQNDTIDNLKIQLANAQTVIFGGGTQ